MSDDNVLLNLNPLTERLSTSFNKRVPQPDERHDCTARPSLCGACHRIAGKTVAPLLEPHATDSGAKSLCRPTLDKNPFQLSFGI